MAGLIPPGTPIAVVAPCGAFDPQRLERGLQIARDAGHILLPLPDLLRPVRYLASSDAQRTDQLIEALTSPDYGAVWIARGGYGLTRILHRLPLHELPQRPVLGFSDVTALFTALHRAGKGPAIHAPVLHSLPQTDAASRAQLFALLANGTRPPLSGEPWVEGEAAGWLCGGNLCLFAATCGTPWQLNAQGAILVLEEIGEPPYRIDRMLQQLVSAGVFDGVRGVVVGELKGCDPPAEADYTLRDLFQDHLAPLGVPVLGELPIGHGAANRAFVWGDRVRIEGPQLLWADPITS